MSIGFQALHNSRTFQFLEQHFWQISAIQPLFCLNSLLLGPTYPAHSAVRTTTRFKPVCNTDVALELPTRVSDCTRSTAPLAYVAKSKTGSHAGYLPKLKLSSEPQVTWWGSWIPHSQDLTLFPTSLAFPQILLPDIATPWNGLHRNQLLQWSLPGKEVSLGAGWGGYLC